MRQPMPDPPEMQSPGYLENARERGLKGWIKHVGQFAKLSYRLIGCLILLVMFGLAVSSLVEKSPTFDEQGFITRGLGYLRGENDYMRVGHPLGLNALNALLLVRDETVKLPTNDPSWQERSFHRPSELFLWEIGNDVVHVMFLARLPTVFLGMLLAALVGRFAYELAGKLPRKKREAAALLALFLIALDPNILAHTRLATTDLGLAAAALLAGYLLWRFLKEPGWRRAIWAGVGFGLLQDTKFTAGLFVGLFGLVILVGVVSIFARRRAGRLPAVLLPLLVGFPVAAFLTLWAAYGFDIGTLPDSLPTLSQLAGRTLPLAHHLEQLLDIGGRLQKSTPSFLLGNYSDSGWWYYFPVAFLVKTPLATLLLLGSAIVVTAFRFLRRKWSGLDVIDLAALLIPPLGYFAIALTSDINLGYRHLLPVLPFLVVFTAVTLVPLLEKSALWRYGLVLLPLWLLGATLWIAPDFLAFFNVLGGGPDNGWRLLVDSNLDWGQDLQRLKPWMDENGVNEVWLSYFGEARPEYYNISYRGLDSNPPRLMNPLARPYYPANPAPGIYAISATTLQGVHFDNHDLFAWFRDKEPIGKIGYSIFLYEVPVISEGAGLQQGGARPLNVALGNIQLDEIAPTDFAQLGTNNIVPRWFDAAQALPLMGDSDSAVLLPPDVSFNGPLAALVEANYRFVYSGQSVTILAPSLEERPFIETILAQDTLDWQSADAVFFKEEENQITLRGFSIPDTALVPGGSLVVLTLSVSEAAEPVPVKMFLHLTALDGEITCQWDGLGIVWQSWLPGDGLVQQHVLPLPDSLPHGEFQLWAGYYTPDDLVRWTAVSEDGAVIDRVPLEVLTFQ